MLCDFAWCGAVWCVVIQCCSRSAHRFGSFPQSSRFFIFRVSATELSAFCTAILRRHTSHQSLWSLVSTRLCAISTTPPPVTINRCLTLTPMCLSLCRHKRKAWRMKKNDDGVFCQVRVHCPGDISESGRCNLKCLPAACHCIVVLWMCNWVVQMCFQVQGWRQ